LPEIPRGMDPALVNQVAREFVQASGAPLRFTVDGVSTVYFPDNFSSERVARETWALHKTGGPVKAKWNSITVNTQEFDIGDFWKDKADDYKIRVLQQNRFETAKEALDSLTRLSWRQENMPIDGLYKRDPRAYIAVLDAALANPRTKLYSGQRIPGKFERVARAMRDQGLLVDSSN
jgi:hypothetical protein